ncbi:histone-lysine N-methyltransferase, H3 lysine-9 specific SUVH4 isoform X2 [Magnolia sinica]|uniref:histone-lysine N-methyltransferase, H3 lysine-9 specific SUVH4 isoform X2 n=1 Tax=Magnolia sinica TaxID=86752 RepID=UPI00265B61F7|nr:histone-lysine N-methyltransferase, H3 lysine-9 specific SUVH4 isoform X2 [Magnolia sinica]
MEIQTLTCLDPVDASLTSCSSNAFDCKAVEDCRSLPGEKLQQEKLVMVCGISSSDEQTKAAVTVEGAMKNGSCEVSLERRVSTRLRNRREKEKSDDGKQNVRVNDAEKVGKKRARVEKKQVSEVPAVDPKCDERVEADLKRDGHVAANDSKRGDSVNVVANEGEENVVIGGGSSSDMEEKGAYSRVMKTLRIFNNHYLHFVQEEEKRCKRAETGDRKISNASGAKGKKKASKKLKVGEGKTAKASKSKGESANVEDIKRSSKRPDLKAISRMIETKAILYPKGRLGHLPGIDVGHQFHSRAEMVVVGLHSHWLNGIDFLGETFRKLEKYKSYTFPLAVSIVMSGQYEDDVDNSEDIVYTGQGGNNLLGNKHQIRDQEMARGNLALKNSMEHGVPVRVTRGHSSGDSYCGKVYTYDGLYKVVRYWAEKGVSGYTVFKYRLRRLEGQPDLTTNQVHFTRKQVPTSLSELRGLVCEDISGGQEAIPIPATNEVDDPPIPPTGYVYRKSIQVPKGMKLPIDAMDVVGCECRGTCIDPKVCACARLNGSEFPYVRKDGGRLVEAKAVVFECGPNCGCGADCVNRTSQRGLKYRLEVFRTPKKGWAVRSWDSIPSGAPVCEYTGILKRTDELDHVSDNNFIFDIDCLQTMEGLDGRERRLGDVSFHTKAHLERSDDKKSESVPEFCIDAGSVGNVARFINHSCQPNLFVQCVLSTHHDIKLARVMLFAADNIPPLQELSYDYGYALDSVVGPDGNIKTMSCYCGAADCRKRLY